MGDRINLRDEHGTTHEVTIGENSITIGDRSIDVRQIRVGEFRVADRAVWAASQGDTRWVFVNGNVYTFELEHPGARARLRSGHEDGLSAPMPATVVKLHVAPGDNVKAGQLLIVLEAMKMELPVRAVADGRVDAIRCAEGELVQPGQPLIDMSAEAEGPASREKNK